MILDAGVTIIYKVWPLFGPVAGGTDVTITGRELNFTSLIIALFPVDNLHYDVIQLHAPIDNRYVDVMPEIFRSEKYVSANRTE